MKLENTKRNILILLVIAQMLFIFCMSAQDGTESSGESLGVTRFVCSVFVSDWDNLPAEEQDAVIEKAHGLIRVGAHFAEYAVLGFLLLLMAYELYKDKSSLDAQKYFLVWLAGVIYAVSDEIHQIFVPGRACELKDVIIDAAGVLLGLAVAEVCRRIIKNA